MNATQPELSASRHPFYVAPGDWARRSLVDEGFVARSVAAMRDLPDAEKQLREALADTLQGIRDIDRVYGTEPNEWATATRERLWLEHFTAEAIMRHLLAQHAGKSLGLHDWRLSGHQEVVELP
jgi:hypothetical protein